MPVTFWKPQKQRQAFLTGSYLNRLLENENRFL